MVEPSHDDFFHPSPITKPEPTKSPSPTPNTTNPATDPKSNTNLIRNDHSNTQMSQNSDDSDKYKRLWEQEQEEKKKLKTELDGLKMRLAQTVVALSGTNSSIGSEASMSPLSGSQFKVVSFATGPRGVSMSVYKARADDL